MNDLERRALLGDRQAQEECTRRRIVLPCPWCKCDDRDMLGLSAYHEQYFYSCEACGCNGPVVRDNDNCDYPEHDALAAWNTRPAPPIGRCGECTNWDGKQNEMRLIDANRLKDDLSELPMMSNWGEAFVPKLIDEQLIIDPETLPLVQQLRKELEGTKQKARAACSLCKALAESNRAQTICDQCPLRGM